MKNLDGKWALILGGSSGLGLASARKLAEHGMNIIVIHRDRKSDMKEINIAFEEIKSNGIVFESFNVDAVSQVKMKTIIKEVGEILDGNKLKVLLHSIAKGNLKPISLDEPSLKSDDFSMTIDSMAISLFNWAMELLNNDLFEDDGRILSFTSEGSSRVHSNYAAVSAAKASLESITRSLALELAPFNIKANCIMAGTTKTRAFTMIPGHEKLEEWSKLRNPYGRLTQPNEVANVVYLLTLDESSWINGITLQVDGGEHLR